MSIRPTSFGVGETWTWNIRLRNLANAAVDADSTPTVTVYKNNSATGESVTVTKPSATTGWYQCSFDPAGEAEHDVYSFVENVTIAAVAQAPFQWHAVVLAAERGTNSAYTGTPATVVQMRQEMDSNSVALAAIFERQGAPAGASQSADIAAVASRLPAELVSGKMSCHVVTIADDAVNVAATDALLVSWIQENLATTAEVEAIPLAALLLDWTTVEDTVPSRSMLNALRHIRNKWSITDTTKTVMCEDGVTPAYTTTITVDSNGNITADTPA